MATGKIRNQAADNDRWSAERMCEGTMAVGRGCMADMGKAWGQGGPGERRGPRNHHSHRPHLQFNHHPYDYTRKTKPPEIAMRMAIQTARHRNLVATPPLDHLEM